MLYYKTSQIVPGKGDAWMYYECDDDQTVRRYMTFIPATGELDKVPKPFIKKLQQPEMLMHCTQEEFHRYWPPDGNGTEPTQQEVIAEEMDRQGVHARKYFDPNMTIMEAMAMDPQVAEVFAAFHLGGCSNCGISEIETVAQVCMGYGVDVDMLLEVLEDLMETETADDDDTVSAEDEEVAPID